MAQMEPSSSKGFQEDVLSETDVYKSVPADISPDIIQKMILERKRKDNLSRSKASRAAVSKRRLHGVQVTDVDWEERQFCTSLGQPYAEIHCNAFVQVKKPLTEVIENPTGSRKLLPCFNGGYERVISSQSGRLKNMHGPTLYEDVSKSHQDNAFFSSNHSNSPKLPIKRVSSDETLNEFVGQGINKGVPAVNRATHKGVKYRKSRENLEIRRRHSSMGGPVTEEEFSLCHRKTMWKKFPNCQSGLSSASADIVQADDFHNEIVSYDDGKDLIQEKRVRRSSIDDISIIKADQHFGEASFYLENSDQKKDVLLNPTKLFMREDLTNSLSSGEFSNFSKLNNFSEEFWTSGNRSSVCKTKYRINEIASQCNLGKWPDISDFRHSFSMAGQPFNCEVPLSLMPKIYSSAWNGNGILRSLNLSKPTEELNMSPIYQSQTDSDSLVRESSPQLPVRKWARQRCLPKIPQIWKEDRKFTTGDPVKGTEEEMEPLSTSTDVGVIESEETSGVTLHEKEDEISKDEVISSKSTSRTESSSTECTISSSSESLESLHIPLRMSLFPYVPPYICFAKHDKKGPPINENIRNIAKWKLGKFTPSIVQLVVKNTGLATVKSCEEYVGMWAKNLTPSGFSHIKESQKINHIPGGFYIGRKDSLCNNLKKMKNLYGNSEYYFVPETYVLPGDIYFLKQEWDEAIGKKEETKWIVKPPAGARGSGVSVIHSWNQIPHSKPIIVQKYIENPYLIDFTKFDLRVYVLITSVHPLRMYVYSEGLVRFASDTYSPDTSTLSDKYVHLTNYSVNKKSSRYMVNQDPTACQGHKWTLTSLWNYLKARNVNVDTIWKQIIDIAIKTFLSGENSITRCTNTYLNSNYPAYELFGLDILLDADLKPWLLEVNISPSLNTSSKLDMSVKGPMISELLNLVGYHLPPTTTLSPTERREILRQLMSDQITDLSMQSDGKSTSQYPGLLFDKRIYTKALSSEEKRKHLAFNDMYTNRNSYCDSILRILMPDDVRHLLIAEDELSQTVRFERVFPALGMHKYYKFFSGPRYYNMLYEAWEKRYHNERNPGIELLRELCRNRLHLRTPLSISSLKFGVNSKPLRKSLAYRRVMEFRTKRRKEELAKRKNLKDKVTVKIKNYSESNSYNSSHSAEELRIEPHETGSSSIASKKYGTTNFRICQKEAAAKIFERYQSSKSPVPLAVPVSSAPLIPCREIEFSCQLCTKYTVEIG